MSRAASVPAATRVQRLLAILQWVAAQPDGATVDAVCERFGVERGAVVSELQMASMIGADSIHYDEMPFEVYVEDGRVWVRLFSFDRPMRLTPAEGLALVASADALLGDDHDPDSPLARALAKVAGVLGLELGEALDVDLDPDGGEVGRALQGAIDERRRVRLTYWSYGRDVVSERVVEPWRVFTDRGAWYLAGLAVEVGEERRFRLDRIEDLEVLDERAPAPPRKVDTSILTVDGAPQVVLDLPAEARWVAEAYPVLDAETTRDGRLLVTLAVAGRSWLERVLLRIGPEARIVRIDPEIGGADLLARAAERVLARYRGGTPEGPR